MSTGRLHALVWRHSQVENEVTSAPVVSIIDDDPSVRDGIVDLVRAMGFDAEAFERAEQFLQSSRLNSTSCLITDMCMPGMTGLELHDRLIASGKTFPTIVITAFPKEADRVRALRAGVASYLAKPFDHRELVACIMSVLGSGDAGKRDRDAHLMMPQRPFSFPTGRSMQGWQGCSHSHTRTQE
jgi:FixJ family two-component response regulator